MVERLMKNEKSALRFASSAFLRHLWSGLRQRPFARWFYPQLWLVHLNLSVCANLTAARACAQIQMDQSWGWNHLASGHCRRPDHKCLRKAEEENFKADFSFFTAEAHVSGVKFIGLYGTVGFIVIWDFSFWGESDLWRPAVDGVVCLSILLEGRVMVSNNFTKRRQNGFKIGTRDKFAIH